jgi:ribonucleoside-diphosphate reductase alpha chain
MCSIAVRALDNSIDVNTPSFEDSAIHNQRYRTIGVGAMGLADWMVKNNLRYSQISIESSASRTLVDELFEKIAYHCTKESVKLAEERGAYPAYEGSEWDNGKLLGSKTIEEIQSRSTNPSAWAVLKDLIKRHGIRNSQITAIAPNTSSSLVQGCTASILPVFSRMFEEKWSKGKMFNSPPLIVDNPLGYEENIHLDQNNIIELTRLLQFWIDTGISMELIFNPNKDAYFKDGEYYEANPKHVFEVLTNSFDGIKAVYYQRFISKGESEKSICLSCAN